MIFLSGVKPSAGQVHSLVPTCLPPSGETPSVKKPERDWYKLSGFPRTTVTPLCPCVLSSQQQSLNGRYILATGLGRGMTGPEFSKLGPPDGIFPRPPQGCWGAEGPSVSLGLFCAATVFYSLCSWPRCDSRKTETRACSSDSKCSAQDVRKC